VKVQCDVAGELFSGSAEKQSMVAAKPRLTMLP
jgi:hypothetical protein